MSFFAGAVSFESGAGESVEQFAAKLWKDLIPSPVFNVTIIQKPDQIVQMGTLPSAATQHALVPFSDPDYPDKIGFALFSGYLFEREKVIESIRKRPAGRWLPNGPISNAHVIGAIIGEIVSGKKDAIDKSLLLALNGIFCFVVWIPGHESLVLGVDRTGIRQLHYTSDGPRFGFSSEVASLAALLPSPQLTPSAVDDLVANRFILGEVTQIESINRVPPGSLVIASKNIIAHTTYWDSSNLPINQQLDDTEYIEGCIRVFSRAIERSKEITQSPILFLSGGLDSRRILLEQLKQGLKPDCWTAVQFSSRLPVEGDSNIAAGLCKKFGLTHHRLEPLDADWEDRWARYARTLMEYDTGQHYWTLPLLKELPVDAGWNFDGYGGDFVVYDSFLDPDVVTIPLNEQRIIDAARIHISGDSNLILQHQQDRCSIEERLLSILKSMPANENTYSFLMANVWSRRRTAAMSQRLLRHKVESVMPYMDNDLLDFSFSFAPAKKVGRVFQHEILMKQYPELMREIPPLSDVAAAGPNSEYWRKFTRALPHQLDLRRKHALSRTGARIVRERLPLPALHPRTRQNALIFSIASIFGVSKHIAMRSYWRLEQIGFLGEMVRFYLQPQRRSSMLAEARRFIYD